MAKKGQTFRTYIDDFKLKAVRAYLEGTASYKVVAKREGIRNCSQLKVWVKKWQSGESFDERKDNEPNPLKGRPRSVFGSIEEERDYLKAQVDYLKKRYPKLRDNGGTTLSAPHYRSLGYCGDTTIQLLQMANYIPSA